MRRLFFFLLVACVFLQAATSPSLERAHKWLAQQTTQSVLKAYHEYKNIRINAIMDANKELQKEALAGIIRSGKLLHMDVTKYTQELVSLGGVIHESSKVNDKPLSVEARPSKVDDKPSINYLKSLRWQGGSIVLEFRDVIEASQVTHFVLDKKFNQKYRYIFDIDAASKSGLMLSKQHLDAVRINSDDKEKVRLVLENDEAVAINYSRKGTRLIISVDGKTTPSTKDATLMLTKESYLAEPTTKSKMKIIVIDPGHGGKDPGAVGYRKYREKIIVFDIAVGLKKELEMLGHKVYLTRKKDVFVNLRDRTAFANKKEADLFISLHANAVARKGKGYSKHSGVETYFLSQARSDRAKNVAAMENSDDMDDMNYFGKESFLHFLNAQKILASNKLAIDLQRGMLSNLRKYYKGIKDGGVREGPFWVLVGAQMPAVLVEVGFITNPTEARHLVDKTYQSRLAQGLALGVEQYLKINP